MTNQQETIPEFYYGSIKSTGTLISQFAASKQLHQHTQTVQKIGSPKQEKHLLSVMMNHLKIYYPHLKHHQTDRNRKHKAHLPDSKTAEQGQMA